MRFYIMKDSMILRLMKYQPMVVATHIIVTLERMEQSSMAKVKVTVKKKKNGKAKGVKIKKK